MSKEKTNTYREIVRSASQVQDQAFGFDNYHAFIVGINNYQFVPPLNTAVNDAQRLAKILADNHGYTVHEVLINPTGAALQSFLIDMKNKVGEKDAVLIYFAGHGIALEDEKGMNGYIVPADAKANDGSTLIPMQFLNECFAALTCRHFLLILDCCFAGSIRWASTQRNIDALFLPKRIYKERFERYIMDKAWQVLASASHDQKAFDSLKGFRNERDTEGLDHSPFALALFEALSGKADIIPADGGDGIITATELYLYLREEVEIPTLAANVRLRQTPSIFTLPNHDKGEFIFFAPNHRLNLPPIPHRNPFKGLQSFDEVDKELFYGRERVVKALLDKVTTQRLTIVTGASGSGKSSLVKAGLIPLLRENGFNVFPVIRPTQKPLEVLAQVNLPENKEKTVWIIDQFEELLTQSNDEDRLKFIEILRGYIQEGLTVIVTVRADFEPQFEMEEWAEWQSGRFPVRQFSVEEIREVIVRPTIQEVLQFDKPSVIDQIIEEVRQSPNALPLLSFTLSELYEKYVNSGRNDRLLTENDYKSLGGVIGSLRKKADKIYTALEPAQQDAMRNMMLRMVSIVGGEYAGKRVFKTDLVFTDPEETKRIETVIKKMEEARLILSDRDNNGRPYVEPAHDALIRSWSKLSSWVKDFSFENINLLSKLTDATSDYFSSPDEGRLWSQTVNLKLTKEEAFQIILNKNEKDFIQKSQQLEEDRFQESENKRIEAENARNEALKEKKKAQQRTWVAIGFLVLAIIGGISFYFQQKIAKDNLNKFVLEQKDKNNQKLPILMQEAKNFENGEEPEYALKRYAEIQTLIDSFKITDKEISISLDSLNAGQIRSFNLVKK